MGMTVFSGMLAATVIGVLIIPALYVLISGRGGAGPDTTTTPPGDEVKDRQL